MWHITTAGRARNEKEEKKTKERERETRRCNALGVDRAELAGKVDREA